MDDDARWITIDGRRWRRSDPAIPESFRKELVDELMSAPTTAGCEGACCAWRRSRPAVVCERHELSSSVRHGPLGSVGTIYETPDGRRCVVTFANRGSDVLSPVRNKRGELWIGQLLQGDVEPAHFDDWEREWVPAELLRPVGDLGSPRTRRA